MGIKRPPAGVAARATVLLLLACLVMFGCTPMPGNRLFSGLSHPTPVDQVDIKVVIDPIKTSVECNSQMWQSDNWHLAMLNCLFNACIVLACAQVEWNDKGEISSCNVFLSFDSTYMLNHELRHCQGYDDSVL